MLHVRCSFFVRIEDTDIGGSAKRSDVWKGGRMSRSTFICLSARLIK